MIYGVGEAYQERAVVPNGVIRMMPPEFDKTFTSIVDARKELYKRIIGKGSPTELYVYNLSNKQNPQQIGCGFRTIVNQYYKVVFDKKWVMWEPLDSRGRSTGKYYYLNKDGTLGAKR